MLIPDALILSFAHDPLAVGIYVAIARLVIAAKQAVPLAARDLASWMGKDREAARAAVMRRIVKLADAGWLSVERGTSVKHRLMPTWGFDAGANVRPWRFDVADSGKPEHLRGRRVPLALLDCYLGRLDPQSGHTPAVISRYFTRPLLDLADIGIYTTSLRAEVTPTPRLLHLGLLGADGIRPLSTVEELLACAAHGNLSTYEADAEVRVYPSTLGRSRLTSTDPFAGTFPHCLNEQGSGSPSSSRSRSASGRPDGSAPKDLEYNFRVHQDADSAVIIDAPQVIAWDVGSLHEPTNQPSPINPGVAGDGHAASVRCDSGDNQPTEVFRSKTCASTADSVMALLEPGVVAGHLALNPLRPVPAGEWFEVLHLQREHGAAQILIWQARATRRANAHPYGVTPAYYRTCATYEDDMSCPREVERHVAEPVRLSGPPQRGDDVELDPACDTLLRAMGVRERRQLAHVPYDLITAWRDALTHPGIATRFTTPLGFAVSQMRQGNKPPSDEELEGWVLQAQRRTNRYESWRYIEPDASDMETVKRESALEARVRTLAPPDADLTTLCTLARLLEDGLSDHEALAQLTCTTGGGPQ